MHNSGNSTKCDAYCLPQECYDLKIHSVKHYSVALDKRFSTSSRHTFNCHTMKLFFANSKLEHLMHRISNTKMRQNPNSPSTRSSEHLHLNTHQEDVNLNDKHQSRSTCISRNAYDAAITVTTSVNVGTALYTNKYGKCSCREKSKYPLMSLCISTNLVYKRTVHTRERTA